MSIYFYSIIINFHILNALIKILWTEILTLNIVNPDSCNENETSKSCWGIDYYLRVKKIKSGTGKYVWLILCDKRKQKALR